MSSVYLSFRAHSFCENPFLCSDNSSVPTAESLTSTRPDAPSCLFVSGRGHTEVFISSGLNRICCNCPSADGRGKHVGSGEQADEAADVAAGALVYNRLADSAAPSLLIGKAFDRRMPSGTQAR